METQQSETPGLEAVLNRIRERLTPTARDEADVVFGIDLSGTGDGMYTIDARKGLGQGLLVGAPQEHGLDPHMRARMSGETFVKLANGKINPQLALMTGKLKVQVDFFRALQLEQFLL
jgi:hypothetical protein